MCYYRSNQVRFRIVFNHEKVPSDKEQFIIGLSELYIGSHCNNACNGHGMCLQNGRCRCDSNWTNSDCSLSSIRFPNEINILEHENYNKCSIIFNSVSIL